MTSSLDDGIDRPRDGHYHDLNYVPWYACMRFAERLAYLDWIIAKRQVEADEYRVAARQKEIAAGATDFFLSNYTVSKADDRLSAVRKQRDIELAHLKIEPTIDGRFRLEFADGGYLFLSASSSPGYWRCVRNAVRRHGRDKE